MPKSEFEKKIIIKARRLQRKKSLKYKMWEEQTQFIKDYFGEDRKFTTEEIKEALQEYIKKAGKISVKERKEENEAKKERL